LYEYYNNKNKYNNLKSYCEVCLQVFKFLVLNFKNSLKYLRFKLQIPFSQNYIFWVVAVSSIKYVNNYIFKLILDVPDQYRRIWIDEILLYLYLYMNARNLWSFNFIVIDDGICFYLKVYYNFTSLFKQSEVINDDHKMLIMLSLG